MWAQRFWHSGRTTVECGSEVPLRSPTLNEWWHPIRSVSLPPGGLQNRAEGCAVSAEWQAEMRTWGWGVWAQKFCHGVSLNIAWCSKYPDLSPTLNEQQGPDSLCCGLATG